MMARQLSSEKRTQFLDSALKLFVEKGVPNTSTAAIAREAGTASGTLFLYFPTKQDLINDLILEITRQQSEVVKAQLAPELAVRETFFAIWETTICWFSDHLEAYQYVQQVRDSGWLNEKVIADSNQYFDYFYTAIQKGLSTGALIPYPLELIGEILYRQIVAVMNLIRIQPDRTKQAEYIQAGFEIFWNGIRKL